MTCPRETGSFERYLDAKLMLAVNVFLIALDDFHFDYPAWDDLFSSAANERHFEMILDAFGNLDAPLEDLS